MTVTIMKEQKIKKTRVGMFKNIVGNIPGENFLGGNFSGGNVPGGSLMRGNFPGGNFPGGSLVGGNFPGGIFPDTIMNIWPGSE